MQSKHLSDKQGFYSLYVWDTHCVGWISLPRKGLEISKGLPRALVAPGAAAQWVWGYHQHSQPARAAFPSKGWQRKARLEFLGLWIRLEGLNK